MKYADARPYAARKLLEIANAPEPSQDGRIYIENFNGPFLFKEDVAQPNMGLASPTPSRRAGWKHESGTCVKFTQAGADLFA
jgi:hypothetical protein